MEDFKKELDKMEKFANVILDLMVKAGDKNAEVFKIRDDLYKLQREILSKYFLPNLENKEVTEKIHNYFMQIKLETQYLIQELEGKNN